MSAATRDEIMFAISLLAAACSVCLYVPAVRYRAWAAVWAFGVSLLLFGIHRRRGPVREAPLGDGVMPRKAKGHALDRLLPGRFWGKAGRALALRISRPREISRCLESLFTPVLALCSQGGD
jgi:hypothetical protein